MDYTTYVNQIATMAVVPSNDPNFQTIIPSMINYAELRIQRDLDFLASQLSSVGIYNTSVALNTVVIPFTDFVTIQTIQILAGENGITLLPVAKEYIQTVYGYGAAYDVPKYFAMYGSDGSGSGYNILLGPTPDGVYQLAVSGTVRFQTLSADNSTNYISLYLPDLLIMASMIYISAYQRNFGRINDDPQMAQTYESQYQALLKGATIEEFRKKFQSSGWTPYSPSPIAAPSR